MYLETATPIELERYSIAELLRVFIQTAVERKGAIAVWRLPNTEGFHAVINLSDQWTTRKIEIEATPPGFVISPFVNPTGEETIYIPADLYYHSDTGELENISGGNEERKRQYLESLTKALEHGSGRATVPYHTGRDPVFNGADQKQHYLAIVDKGLRAIERGIFQKVVTARTKQEKLAPDFNLVLTFLALAKTYPAAFASLFSVPGYGTWMGVSPELLIQINRERIFRTVSLAGTQPINEDVDPARAAWTQKEIEEQAMVSRFIINQFKKIRLREFEEFGPRTVAAGNLMHLKTDFTVDMNSVNFPELGSVMLFLLHPTSAVCGMPKRRAIDFILNYETFDRAFYSGYLGPVNIQDETYIYVNLRCMQLFADKTVLYAGSGITHDSDPEKEWEETNLKCQTLLNVLRH
ncbi:MAG: chorismate-binding protein [FCB group bacterium]|nr:chorismate-binding protein [FCB group bacterium]